MHFHTRAVVATLFAAALLLAPIASTAHAVDHHGALDSVDCGTCHWASNAAAVVADAPAPHNLVWLEVVRDAVPAEPHLRLGVLDLHTRGPPSSLA